MSKRAEELGTAFANEMSGIFPNGAPKSIVDAAIESLAGALTEMIEGYGQEVREACAKVCDARDDVDNCMEPAILASNIREMPLP